MLCIAHRKYYVLLFFLISVFVFTLDAKPANKKEKLYNTYVIKPTDKNFRYVENNAYGFGEKLEYKVGYKFITAGTGFFEIMPEPVEKFGRSCYDIRFAVNSLKSLEWIYKVRNRYTSLVDVGAIFPWEFTQKNREGNYKRDFKAVFDPYKNKAVTKDSIYDTPEYVHDVVSAFYYVRTMNLQKMNKGDRIYLKNFFDDTTYNLGVEVMGRETIDVDAGEFKCVVIKPLVMEGGLFKSEGHIYIWLTDDERKIPVKVATKILIGYVGAELVKYSGVRGKIDAKLN
jgi:hypothetical protein